MGKAHFDLTVTLTMMTSGHPGKGIDFKEVQKVIDYLPGHTFLYNVEQLPKTDALLDGIWRFFIENENLSDGTEIKVRYKTITQNYLGGRIEIFDIFTGLDIIDPSPPNANNAVNMSNINVRASTSGKSPINIPPSGAITTPASCSCHFRDLLMHGCQCGGK